MLGKWDVERAPLPPRAEREQALLGSWMAPLRAWEHIQPRAALAPEGLRGSVPSNVSEAAREGASLQEVPARLPFSCFF